MIEVGDHSPCIWPPVAGKGRPSGSQLAETLRCELFMRVISWWQAETVSRESDSVARVVYRHVFHGFIGCMPSCDVPEFETYQFTVEDSRHNAG